MDVVHEADYVAPTPQGREERHAVLDVDDQIPLSVSTRVGYRRPQVLRIGATDAPDVVDVVVCRAAAKQRDFVAASHKAFGQSVDQYFGAARLSMGEAPPRDERDAQRTLLIQRLSMVTRASQGAGARTVDVIPVTDRVLTTQVRQRFREKWGERLELFRLFLRERQRPAPFYERLAAQSIESLPQPVGGARVLDLGSGPGHYTKALRRAGATVVPIDADLAELDPSDAPVDGAVVANAQHLPLRDRCLDGVFCSNVLEHTGAPATMLAEIERVLRDGGWLWLSWTNWYSPWGGHELSPWHYFGQGFAVRIYERRTGQSPKNAPGRSLFPVHVGRTLDLLRVHPGFQLVDAVPRYYPRQRWILRIPGLREVATWNCLVYLERRDRAGPMLTTTASTASNDNNLTGRPKAP